MIKKVNYVICTTPRSGSTYFCGVLEKGGIMLEEKNIGPFYEIFKGYKIKSLYLSNAGVEKNLQKIFDNIRTKKGFSGFKLMKNQLPLINILLGNREDKFILLKMNKNYFPKDTKFIWLIRKNIVRQAISYYLAVESGFWKKERSISVKTPPILFDKYKIAKYVGKIMADNYSWEKFFRKNKITPLVFYYGDFVSEDKKCLLSIEDFFGSHLSKSNFKSTLKKQSNSINDLWENKYQRHKFFEYYSFVLEKNNFVEKFYQMSQVLKIKSKRYASFVKRIKGIFIVK